MWKEIASMEGLWCAPSTILWVKKSSIRIYIW